MALSETILAGEAGHIDAHRGLHRRYNRLLDVSDFGDIHAAVAVAIQQGGGTVYLPAGIYALTEPLIIEASNVQIVGDGRSRTIIEVDVGLQTDGIVFRAVSGYNRNCGLSHLAIRAATRYQSVRDLLVLEHMADVRLEDVLAQGAGRYNTRMDYVLSVQAQYCKFDKAGMSPLWVGSAEGSISTTTTFISCAFREAQYGPGADVAGFGIQFFGCYFESNGTNGAEQSTGITVRSGYVSLFGCYWENNASYDVLAGRDGMTHLAMVGFHSLIGPYSLLDKAHIYVDQYTHSAAIVGGRMTTRSPAILIHPSARDVHGMGIDWASGQPRMSDGSDIYNAPAALLIGAESSSGRQQILGRFDLRGRILQHTGLLAGFYGSTPVARPALTYSRSGETAVVGQIRQALATLGLVSDGTTD